MLRVEGLPPSIYAVTGDRVSLFPGKSESLWLRLQTPPGAGIFAGDYEFRVVATSADDPNEVATEQGVLHVLAAGGLSLALEPQRVAGRRGLFELTITNDGNAAAPTVIELTDAEEALRYALGTPVVRSAELRDDAGGDERSETVMGETLAGGDGSLQHEIEVPAGGSVGIPLLVSPSKRRWTGKEVRFAFEARTHPPGVEWEQHQMQVVRGELAYRPMLAMWYGLPGALRRALPIVLGLLFLGVLLWLLFRPPDQPPVPQIDAQATQTALAAQNAVSATLTAIAVANQNGQGNGDGNNGNGNGNGGQGNDGETGPSPDGVPSIRKYWLEIPTAQAETGQGEPNLQYDITAAQSVVISPTTREESLQGWETSKIIDYQLMAVGERGTATDTLSVLLVRPPSIGQFTAEPLTITLGESSNLLWMVLGAQTTTLDGSSVNAGAIAADGEGRTGSISVQPPETSEYVFCAGNLAGQTCQSLTITVVPPTPVPDTETPTPTATATETFTPVPTNSSTPTNTLTPTPRPPTGTSVPPTSTSLPLPTNTLPLLPPTFTPTLPPTITRTFTPTSTTTTTPTFTPTETSTPTSTSTPTFTVTSTPTATFTATSTPTDTASPTPTLCPTYEPTDVPKPIYGYSYVDVPVHGLVASVRIHNLHMYATPVTDYFNVFLVSPYSRQQQLIYQIVATYHCLSADAPYEMNVDLDDNAGMTVELCNPDQAIGTFKPLNPLSVFNGIDAYGMWALGIEDPRIIDASNGSMSADSQSAMQVPRTPTPTPALTPQPTPEVSTLEGWVLEICFTNGESAYYTVEGR